MTMLSLKYIPVGIAVLIIAYLASLSFASRNHRLKSENQREISRCPGTPNCVSSVSLRDGFAIPAFSIVEEDRTLSWERLIDSIQQNGGEILLNDGQYCHAVFTSGVFRFKDDLEAAINETQIDIRSASRAGTSDFGQNRKRVEKIRSVYLTKMAE